MGTSVAATCWQMLIALQLPRHECFLMRHRTPRDFETLSKVDETIIPAIAELEPVRIQPDTITSEAHLDARWDYIRGLARAGVEGLQDKPNAAETDAAQTYDRLRIPLDITLNYHARAKRVTASLPRDLALAIMEKIQEKEGRCGPRGFEDQKQALTPSRT